MTTLFAPFFTLRFWGGLAGIGWMAIQTVAAQEMPTKEKPMQAVSSEVSTAPLAYRSVFTDYQRYSEVTVDGWQEKNATVLEIGGWREYLREIARDEISRNQP